MKFIHYLILLLAITLFAACSDEKAEKVEQPESTVHQVDRDAEMKELLRQTKIYAQQEEEKRQQEINI
jgi:hypothetical protein